MNIIRKKTKTESTVLITLLMISTAFLLFSNSADTTVKATVPADMLQYEWRSARSDAEGTMFSDGPGPNAPNIKWKTKIPGVAGNPVAFNGLVFVQAAGTTYALDGGTGDIVWTTPISGGLVKIDDTYMVIGNDGIKIADGTVVWTGPPGFDLGTSVTGGVGYVPEYKMFADPYGFGWSLPDPSQPPTMAWNNTDELDVGHGDVAYGDGKVFHGVEDMVLRAYDIMQYLSDHLCLLSILLFRGMKNL